MARNPKTIEEARTNLEASLGSIRSRYENGINRVQDFVASAASDQSENNYAEGVNKAIANKSRAAGIRRAGNEGYKNGALNKGAPRIAEGIRAGLAKYTTNSGRVQAAVATLLKSLPPRSLDPMSNIDQRLKPVVKKQVEMKGQKTA